MSEIKYVHRDLKEAIFNLVCLAYIGVKDRTLIENLNADCDKELSVYDDLKKRYAKLYRVLEIIKNKYVYVAYFTWVNNVHEYNKHVAFHNGIDMRLNQEEYDLLKEVLL